MTSTFLEHIVRNVGDVLETMDLTVHVEGVVQIGSSPLDLEDVRQVHILFNVSHEAVDELWLGVWLCIIGRQVLENLVLHRMMTGAGLVKESESRDEVHL